MDHVITLSNGLRLGYAEYGDPRGEVAFYFHGWPSSRLQGCLFDDLAKKHGMRLICPDRPGIGLSDPQPGRTLADWQQTLTELAAHVGADNWHVIAWSGGGPYLLSTALLMPKRLLSASIICGAPHPAPQTAAHGARRHFEAGSPHRGDEARMPRASSFAQNARR